MKRRVPGVDVIVPCYNYGIYLAACVSGILEQPGVEARVLVIDDASGDSTCDVAGELARKDSRVTYRRHDVNAGHIATYNEGIEWAASDYVLLISADDLVTPGALARAAGALDRHPEAVFAHGRQIVFADDPALPNTYSSDPAADTRVQTGSAFIGELCRQGHNPVATPTVVVRTAAQKRAGGYDAALPHTADLEMWLRLATAGDVVCIDAFQAFKRHHATNMQHQFLARTTSDVNERILAFERFFAGAGARLANAAGQLDAARQAVARELLWRAGAALDARRDDAYREQIDLARRLHPNVVRTALWRRLAIRRMVGFRAWSGLAALRAALRA